MNEGKIEIMNKIEAIKLLRGHRSDINKTGQGCFMDVVSYLNGESVITDKSECVCPSVRPIAIWLNDFANNKQRQRMLPFVVRAVGSVTDDNIEMERRLALVVRYADRNAGLIAASAESPEYAKSAMRAAKCAAESARYAKSAALNAAEYVKHAKYAAQSSYFFVENEQCSKRAALHAEQSAEYVHLTANYAANCVEYAFKATGYAYRQEVIFQFGLDFLDEVLPQLGMTDWRVLDRIIALQNINETHK